jgi:lipopolysaccharide export system protein LptA
MDMKSLASQKRIRIITAAACVLLSLTSMLSHAEKADKLKKTLVTGASGGYDGKTDTTIINSNAEVTRGTLLIRADKAIDKELAEGGGSVVLTSNPGNQVFFRQKRDGEGDLWIEGYADRVEYDKKTETVVFMSKAKVKFLSQQKVTKELSCDFLSYDSANDLFNFTNSSTGKTAPGAERCVMSIEPAEKAPAINKKK